MDNSFITLYPTFSQAKFDRMADSQRYYNGGVCMHPSEKYLQITNSKVDIAFGESYKVEVIDCSEKVLDTVTNKFYLYSFQDHNGIYQIAFEILPLGVDYGFNKVYFKFTGLSNNAVFYTNDFVISEDVKKASIRLEYKDFDINNDLANDYQAMRFLGFFNEISERQESKLYVPINGMIRRSRVISNIEYGYQIERLNAKGFKSLANALISDIIYINGERATILEELQSGERKGKSNLLSASFNCTLNEDDTFEYTNQIAPIFNYTDLSPLGTYTVAGFHSSGQATFNYNISSVASIIIYNYDTYAVEFTVVDINITDNIITFAITPLANGNYYIKMLGITNELEEVLNIDNKETWKFNIQNGDFLGSDFISSDFLIN